MSEAENLLNTLDDTSVATADPTTEEHIVIDSNRNIYVPEALRRIAVQYDHNIETVTFDCPRYWDGIDMSKMKVYINYRRSDGKTGRYHAEKVTIDEQWYLVGEMVDSGTFEYDKSSSPIDFSEYESYTIIKTDNYFMTDNEPVYELICNEGTINEYRFYVCNNQGDPNIMHFDWVVSRNATETKGLLSFLVCINTTDETGNEVRHWNSELNQQMVISEGLETDENIEEMYPDIITQLLIKMDTIEADNAATRDYIDNGIKTEVDSTIQEMVENGTITGVDLSGYATNEVVSELTDDVQYNDQRITNLNSISQDHDQFISGIADYPVEVKTVINGDITWIYEKMNSGIIKLWATIKVSYADANFLVAEQVQLPTKLVGTEMPYPLGFGCINTFSITDINNYTVRVYTHASDGVTTITVANKDGSFTSNSTLNVAVQIVGKWK